MTRHAEIAGAGFAGLVAATALGRRGWSVRVHEANAELREYGAGLFLWGNGFSVLETIGEDELLDPTISAETLLFRLFHEDGVRVFEAKPLKAFCRCSQERIVSVLKSFGEDERADMVEDDGQIRVTCEYCSRVYDVDPASLA